MQQCGTCGNQYDKTLQITLGNEEHTFDSCASAIQALAPTCAHCSCRILGHGTEAEGEFYCCARCASRSGHSEMVDRA